MQGLRSSGKTHDATTNHPAMSTNRDNLTPTQERVMKWLYGGWTAREEVGAVEINGNRVCAVSTMNALLNKGMIIQEGNIYSAKRCPCCRRTKPLTAENVCDDCYL